MKIWKVTCRVDDGARIYQETQHVVAPTEKQAAEASLHFWRNESYDTDATVVAITGLEVKDDDVIIL